MALAKPRTNFASRVLANEGSESVYLATAFSAPTVSYKNQSDAQSTREVSHHLQGATGSNGKTDHVRKVQLVYSRDTSRRQFRMSIIQYRCEAQAGWLRYLDDVRVVDDFISQ